MLCPFCQYDLNIEEMACPNCGAEFPRGGVWAGLRLRTLAISGGMLILASVILVDCVLNYLPGGRNSGFYAPGSPQAALGPGPDLKSPQLQQLLQSWQNNVQPSQNPAAEVKHSMH